MSQEGKKERKEKRGRRNERNEKTEISIGTDFDMSNLVQYDFPLQVNIKHNGFWITNDKGIHVTTNDITCDRNSVMLLTNNPLYIIKLALRHLLLSMEIITPDEIDAANLVPHIMVRKNNKDPFSKHDIIQNSSYIITEKDISIKKDFIMFEIDRKNDLHMTLVFSKDIKNRIDLLMALKYVIRTLNTNPELMREYENLPYFAENAIHYWYETRNGFPFLITPPVGWQKKKPIAKEFKTSPLGSIIE